MILDAVAFLRKFAAQPWLVLGKGPSFDRLGELGPAVRGRRTLALNHACLRAAPDVAHFTDLAAFLDCGPALGLRVPDEAVRVALPWHPHVDFRPGRQTLLDQARRHPATLGWLLEQGRLLSYNSTLAGRLPAHPKLAEVPVRLFSAVAAVNLLAAAGVRDVALLGVDGGTGYAAGFDPKDRLANGRPDFDAQFAEIEKAAARHRMAVTNLGRP
jgi:hypothetical protein